METGAETRRLASLIHDACRLPSSATRVTSAAMITGRPVPLHQYRLFTRFRMTVLQQTTGTGAGRRLCCVNDLVIATKILITFSILITPFETYCHEDCYSPTLTLTMECEHPRKRW